MIKFIKKQIIDRESTTDNVFDCHIDTTNNKITLNVDKTGLTKNGTKLDSALFQRYENFLHLLFNEELDNTRTYKLCCIKGEVKMVANVYKCMIDISNITSSVGTEINAQPNEVCSFTLTPETGYALPENISFDSKIKTYSYNKETGNVVFVMPFGDCKIVAKGLSVFNASISIEIRTGNITYNNCDSNYFSTLSTSFNWAYGNWVAQGSPVYPYIYKPSIHIENYKITPDDFEKCKSYNAEYYYNWWYIEGTGLTNNGRTYERYYFYYSGSEDYRAGISIAPEIFVPTSTKSTYSYSRPEIAEPIYIKYVSTTGQGYYNTDNREIAYNEWSCTSDVPYQKYVRDYWQEYYFSKITWREQLFRNNILYSLQSGQGTTNATYKEVES